MKIGIDTFGCDHGKSGLGSYISYFVSNLPSDLVQFNKEATTINADTEPTVEDALDKKLKIKV